MTRAILISVSFSFHSLFRTKLEYIMRRKLKEPRDTRNSDIYHGEISQICVKLG